MTTHRVSPRSVLHRSPAMRLDPYAVEDCTITLEEWRRLREPEVVTPRR